MKCDSGEVMSSLARKHTWSSVLRQTAAHLWCIICGGMDCLMFSMFSDSPKGIDKKIKMAVGLSVKKQDPKDVIRNHYKIIWIVFVDFDSLYMYMYMHTNFVSKNLIVTNKPAQFFVCSLHCFIGYKHRHIIRVIICLWI